MIGHNFLFESHTSKAARAALALDYRSPSGAATVKRSAQATPGDPRRQQLDTRRHYIRIPPRLSTLSLHLYEPLRHSQYSRHHHVDVPAATQGLFNTNVHVSEDMRRQYMEFAEGSIRKVFTLSDCHKNSWIPMREKKGVAIYRNFDQMHGPKAYKSNVAEKGCKGQLSASLDQVGRAYAAHDDALFKRLMKKLIPVVMDAAVLLTIAPRTSTTPCRYIGIKWYAVKTPKPIVSHFDYCCLEVEDKIVRSFGNEMYIRVLNSIEINECPSLKNSHGIVRSKVLAVYMYRIDRAEPNVVSASFDAI